QGGTGGTASSQGTQTTGQGGNRPARPVRPTTGQYGTTVNPRPVQARPQPTPTQQARQTQPSGAKRLGDITPEKPAQFAGQETPPPPKQLEEARRRLETQARGGGPSPGVAAPQHETDDEDRPGGRAVPGRADRHKERAERQKARKSESEG